MDHGWRDLCEAFARAGLDYRVPPPDQRADMNTIIFDELVRGQFLDTSRARVVAMIEGLKREGCDAVALSCTEIPLLVTQNVSPLPILDSTRLLARAAVDVAYGEPLYHQWRGGTWANSKSDSLSANSGGVKSIATNVSSCSSEMGAVNRAGTFQKHLTTRLSQSGNLLRPMIATSVMVPFEKCTLTTVSGCCQPSVIPGDENRSHINASALIPAKGASSANDQSTFARQGESNG